MLDLNTIKLGKYGSRIQICFAATLDQGLIGSSKQAKTSRVQTTLYLLKLGEGGIEILNQDGLHKYLVYILVYYLWLITHISYEFRTQSKAFD